jgi:hypothetical protein
MVRSASSRVSNHAAPGSNNDSSEPEEALAALFRAIGTAAAGGAAG